MAMGLGHSSGQWQMSCGSFQEHNKKAVSLSSLLILLLGHSAHHGDPGAAQSTMKQHSRESLFPSPHPWAPELLHTCLYFHMTWKGTFISSKLLFQGFLWLSTEWTLKTTGECSLIPQIYQLPLGFICALVQLIHGGPAWVNNPHAYHFSG